MTNPSSPFEGDIETVDLGYRPMSIADLYRILYSLLSGRAVQVLNRMENTPDSVMTRLKEWAVAEHEARVRSVRERERI